MTLTLVETGIETRAAHVADVDFPKRIVTVIAMPYEQPTQIHERGRSFTEVVTRNAFDGIERRTSQIKANRDHNWEKGIGRVIAVHPSRTEGLVTEIRLSRSRAGEDALLDCADEVLGASAGFGLLRRDGNSGPVHLDAETWESNNTIRRLNRLWLDHVALVANPAYPGAVVESVRNTPTGAQESVYGDATPNRDKLTVAEQKAAADALNRRWVS